MNQSKSIFIITFLISLNVIKIEAQIIGENQNHKVSDLAKDFRLDFAVPDAPAFKLIEVDESNILRPTSVRELGIGLSDFAGTDNSLVTIPRGFAVEFAPVLLIRGKTLSLRDYQRNRWLYNLRISGATKRLPGASGPSEIAFGLRMNLIDKADIRNDSARIEDDITDITDRIRDIYTVARTRIGPPPTPIVLSPDERKMVDELNNKLKEQWTDDGWNQEVLDVAFALRATSSDSLGNKLQLEQYSFWFTYGRGFLDKGGQWLIGQNAGIKKDLIDGDFKLDLSIASRVYVGVNNYKAFIEAQVSKMEGHDAELLFNSGGEATLGKSSWLIFSAGTKRNAETSEWDIVSNFKFKIGLPGLN